jgi:hypothetical protein
VLCSGGGRVGKTAIAAAWTHRRHTGAPHPHRPRRALQETLQATFVGLRASRIDSAQAPHESRREDSVVVADEVILDQRPEDGLRRYAVRQAAHRAH